MLLRLLKPYAIAPIASRIRETLDGRLTVSGLQAEADNFRPEQNRSFERMYGWTWALRLAEELHGFDDPHAQRC